MISGKNIFLKGLNPKERKQIKGWGKDPEIARFTEIYEKPKKKLKVVAFGIHDKASLKLIGDIAISSIDLKNRHAEIGLTIGDKNYWGKGYGMDSVKTATNYCFNKLNLNKVYLDVWEDNKKAIRCYNKCGFKIDGILRKHVKKGKRYYNKIIMSILKQEWNTPRDKANIRWK